MRDELAADRDTLAAARDAQAECARRARVRRARSISREVEAARGSERALAAAIRDAQAGAGSTRGPGAVGGRVHLARATGRSSAASACAGGGCTRGSTSLPRPGRRSGRPLPGPSSTRAGSAATGTSSSSTTATGWRRRTRTRPRSSSAVGQSVSQGRDDLARRLDRQLVGPAPPLRGARERQRRSTRCSTSSAESSAGFDRGARGSAAGSWDDGGGPGSARQRSSSPRP